MLIRRGLDTIRPEGGRKSRNFRGEKKHAGERGFFDTKKNFALSIGVGPPGVKFEDLQINAQRACELQFMEKSSYSSRSPGGGAL